MLGLVASAEQTSVAGVYFGHPAMSGANKNLSPNVKVVANMLFKCALECASPVWSR